MQSDWAAQILRYWFEELQPEAWFRSDARVDAAIRERFGSCYEQLTQIRPEQLATPSECLAAVIVLDQFPRNMFRGQARTYETDAIARAVADRALKRGFDHDVPQLERRFFYLPFMHSEILADQERCLELARGLGDDEVTQYAELHAGIIRRFGRFPHRNAMLGRAMTPDEQAFLDADGFAG